MAYADAIGYLGGVVQYQYRMLYWPRYYDSTHLYLTVRNLHFIRPADATNK